MASHDSASAGPAAPVTTDRLSSWPLDARSVRLDAEGHLGRWQELNATATIPHSIEMLETSGTLDNLRRVLDPALGAFVGYQFADSDVYKVVEAVAWEIGRTGTREFDQFLDTTFALLESVQLPDGYLNSHVQGTRPGEQFHDLRWEHELYCTGHLIQAAVALARAAQRTDYLALARRSADLLVRRDAENDQPDVCGHPEIETALVELYRTTGAAEYLRLAQRMVDARGVGVLGPDRLGPHYFQDHAPVRASLEATGHAVRQLYLNAGVTDLYTECGDEQLIEAMRAQWDSAHGRKMYLTGAMGSRHFDESFGDDYELPPDRAYAETCASIADIQWTWRMSLVARDSRFADAIERALLNSVAAAVSEDGRAFFYSNPLHLRAGHREEENAPSQRTPWYSCACCPPNIGRLVASLHTYVASADADELSVHQYAAGTIGLPEHLGAGRLVVTTDYPRSGRVEIAVDGTLRPGARIALRVPAWARTWQLVVDGAPLDLAPGRDGYLVLDGAPSLVVLDLAMPVSLVAAHPRVDAVRGTVAVVRGPIVYCAEQSDHDAAFSIEDVRLPDGAEFEVGPGERGGLPVLRAVVVGAPTSAEPLYRDVRDVRDVADHETPTARLTAIPYATWGNRDLGPMRVWLPRA